MFSIDAEKTIHLTRGDVAAIEVNVESIDGNSHTLKQGDVVRFKVTEKSHCESVVLEKDIVIDSETSVVHISLTSEDTRIGDVISKPKIYWYEIEINPDTVPQTIIGYDASGPKLFKLYPEGGNY